MFIIKKADPTTPAARALLQKVKLRELSRESMARRRKLDQLRAEGADWVDLLAKFPRSRRMIANMRERETDSKFRGRCTIKLSRIAIPEGYVRTSRGLERKARKSAGH